MTRADELLTIERIAALRRVEMFAGVPGNKLVAVARLLEEVRVAAGETVIERGECEDWLFVVAEGRVRSHIGERVLAEGGPGEIVGEMAVLVPAARAATVTAVEPSLLLKLCRGPFGELLEDEPALARAVIESLVVRLQAQADDTARQAGL
ncbi:MAG TPA: cyclic nucleotide-binding domain-containing protein [Microthrixaceae bacterium]|nr:cyclic nucleotide-binding domain-containing protein [Microthrixaceae bacterium]